MPYLVRGKSRSRINRRRALSETPTLHPADNIPLPDNTSENPIEEVELSEKPGELQDVELVMEDAMMQDEGEVDDEGEYCIQPVGEPVSITEHLKETTSSRKKKRR